MRSLRVVVVSFLVAVAAVLPGRLAGAEESDEVPAGDIARLAAGVGLEVVVASGLSLASDLAAPPGDDRLFVAELKTGRIRIVENGTLRSTPFLDISGLVQTSSNEQGLLGLTFPPDYADTGLFYVHYSAKAGSGDTAVAEYSVSADPNVADSGSGRVLLTVDQPFGNHNGGAIHIGPDGFLYVGLGDGGGGGDPGENGQNKGTVLGTILRLDPDTGHAAPGNPFIGKAGDDRVWLYGLRNPWRFSFDAATGDMYIGDVGQGAREEVDFIPAGANGLNLGWDEYEGSRCYEGPCSPAGFVFPVHEYSHGPGPICGSAGGSITGGYVYRGNELPWLRGHYFYADWCLGELGSFRMQGKKAVQHIDWTQTLAVPNVITSFGIDGFGELYLTSGGRIYRFVNERGPDCDFNDDGYGDVSVGVPGESRSGAVRAGVFMEFPGSSGTFDPATGGMFLQGRGGVAGTPETDDGLGSALACGDFDGDGFGDLAVGVPGDEGVHVLYGGSDGLSGTGSDFWTKSSLGIGTTAPDDDFGGSLAAGDINRDGYDDLVVGAGNDSEPGAAAAGSATVVFGGNGGLSAAGAAYLHQDASGIKDVAEAADHFGAAVAVGDIDGDGFADVVAGAPGETVAGKPGAGAVAVIFGKASGVSTRDTFVRRNSPGIKGKPAPNAGFGAAIATGGFNNDGFDDLAIGITGPKKGGTVQVIYGSVGGPSQRDALYAQGKGNIIGRREAGDGFGAILAAGDSDGDGFDELAIGVPGEDHRGSVDGGIVGVIPGGSGGLDSGGYRVWHRKVPGIKGALASDDFFGAALRFVDTRGDGRLDLIIGAPAAESGGSVSLIPGKGGGLSAAGDSIWSQKTAGVSGEAEPGDRFGGAL